MDYLTNTAPPGSLAALEHHMIGLVTTALLAANVAATPPVVVWEDVTLTNGRVTYLTGWSDGTVDREAYIFDYSQIGPDDPDDPPTPFETCVAQAIVTCGAGNVLRVKFTSGPGDAVSCEFECKPGTGTGG